MGDAKLDLNTPEGLARFFHDAYETLAPSFGYETRSETRQFDPASKNGKLMIAVCSIVLVAKTAPEPFPRPPVGYRLDVPRTGYGTGDGK